eukprot:SM000175S03314  [mRNA]  locus=s175:193051:196656:+ [translate_table: standard]
MELARLENELKGKLRELEAMAAENKALRQTEHNKDRAVLQLSEEASKLRDKLAFAELQLADKVQRLRWGLQNVEVKRLEGLKKAALASKEAAEAIARRLQAGTKDVVVPLQRELLAPLEADLRLSQQEVARLQELCKAQERLMRAKEAAIVDMSKKAEAAEARIAACEGLQNSNLLLGKQIERLQEECKVFERQYRQKVEEVKEGVARIAQLEEALTASGSSASTIKHLAQQIAEMQGERRAADEELQRAKVQATRVAVAVANDWKDNIDKVIPMKQWLDERKHLLLSMVPSPLPPCGWGGCFLVLSSHPAPLALQGEAQALREKLAIADRSCRSEQMLKEKYQLRLKVLEEGLRSPNNTGVGAALRRLPTGTSRTPPMMSPRSDNSDRSVASQLDELSLGEGAAGAGRGGAPNGVLLGECHHGGVDEPAAVSDVLYNTLQREVLALRRAAVEKEQTLKDKDDAIEILSKRVETLGKALESEGKKFRREVAARDKQVEVLRAEAATARLEQQSSRRLSSPVAETAAVGAGQRAQLAASSPLGMASPYLFGSGLLAPSASSLKRASSMESSSDPTVAKIEVWQQSWDCHHV